MACARKAAIVFACIFAVLCAFCVVVAAISRPVLDDLIVEGIKDQRSYASSNSTGYNQWTSSDYPGWFLNFRCT